jgi:multiple sugar transport system permease protein/raffinose/stachyose/melibiose transport system permease protein
MVLGRKKNVSEDRIGYLLISPFYIFFFFFIALPIIINIILSFTRYDFQTIEFVGLSNYIRLFKDQFFVTSLRNTGVYTFFTLFTTMALSLIVAVVLNESFLFQKVYRTFFFLPHVISMVAASMIWLWLYEPSHGAINDFLTSFGVQRIEWMYDVRYALPGLIIMGIWKNLGYNMVIYLAGLQTIPNYMYEAATIDGATVLQKFFRITFPMLAPVTFFLFVTGLIFNFNVFEQVLIMTNGGPLNSTTTIVHQVYTRAFFQFLMGYASAMAVLAVIIVAFITLINFRYGNQGVDLDVG